jgi:hypothetical protein
MAQPDIAQLLDRIRVLETQIQRMQEQYPVRQGESKPAAGRYGDYRIATASVAPAEPAVAEQELREGEQAQTERRATVAEMPLPDFDPYAVQESAEGTPDAIRRQRAVQAIKRQQARKQAQDDQFVLNQSTMDIDSQPPDAQFKAAQAFADEHREKVASEQAGRTQTLPAQRQGPLTPFQQGNLPAMSEASELPQRPEGEAGQRWDRQQRREAQRQPPRMEDQPQDYPSPRTQPPPQDPYQPEQPPPYRPPTSQPTGQPPYRQPLPPPYIPQPDTNTQIPQPPDWRDTPERISRGPTSQQQPPQQQSFGQMQASFDAAIARQLAMVAGFVQEATRRVEELECWRESMSQE